MALSLASSFLPLPFFLNYFTASCRHQDISPLNALAHTKDLLHTISLPYLSLTSIRFYMLKFLTLHFFDVTQATEILHVDTLLK